MKTILIILSFIFFGITSSLQAQNNRYDWGIEGGPNLSTFRVKNNPFLDAHPKIFASGGFIFQYNTKKILSFKTGFSYQRKGYQHPDLIFVDQNGNYTGKGSSVSIFDYITLPILVKASFGQKVKFFVNAGPYAGFLLEKTDRTTLDTSEGNEIIKNHNMNGLKRWDFGFAGGIGIAVPIKESWMVHMEVRNYYGISNIYKGSNVQYFTNTTDLRIGGVYKLGFYKYDE